MKKYKFGIVGAGYAGSQHMEAIENNSRTELVSIFTRNSKKVKDFSRKNKAQCISTNFDDIINSGIDVLIVSTPDHLHTEYVIKALKSGINVLCEKPLATNLKEAKLLVKQTRSSGKLLMVGFCGRFFEISQLVKNTIDKKKLGEIFYGEASYLFDHANYFNGWHLDTIFPFNPVFSVGSHPIDLLLWLVGDVEQVQAVANKKSLSSSLPIYYDCISVNLKFKNEAIGKLLISVGCKCPQSINIALYGTKGTMVNNHLYLDKKNYDDFKDLIAAEEEEDVFARQINYLIKCLDNNKQPMMSVIDGAKNTAICLAIIKSIKTGRNVEVFNDF